MRNVSSQVEKLQTWVRVSLRAGGSNNRGYMSSRGETCEITGAFFSGRTSEMQDTSANVSFCSPFNQIKRETTENVLNGSYLSFSVISLSHLSLIKSKHHNTINTVKNTNTHHTSLRRSTDLFTHITVTPHMFLISLDGCCSNPKSHYVLILTVSEWGLHRSHLRDLSQVTFLIHGLRKRGRTLANCPAICVHAAHLWASIKTLRWRRPERLRGSSAAVRRSGSFQGR